MGYIKAKVKLSKDNALYHNPELKNGDTTERWVSDGHWLFQAQVMTVSRKDAQALIDMRIPFAERDGYMKTGEDANIPDFAPIIKGAAEPNPENAVNPTRVLYRDDKGTTYRVCRHRQRLVMLNDAHSALADLGDCFQEESEKGVAVYACQTLLGLIMPVECDELIEDIRRIFDGLPEPGAMVDDAGAEGKGE